MAKHTRSIHRSLLLGGVFFIVALCALLAVQAYSLYSASLYQDRNAQLESTITYVEHNVDADDLQECVKTGIPSTKHQELQQLLNMLVDDLGLDYLYLTIPLDDENGTMVNVVSATSAEERASGEEDLPLLFTDPLYYYGDDIKPYVKAMANPEISFFEEESESGACYTACKPVIASNGETVCLICADLYISDLHDAVNTYVLYNVLMTVVIGIVFALALMWWLRRNVTGPILVMERRAHEFADIPRAEKSLESIQFDSSDIHTGNEVESLANAISTMADDMREYLSDSLQAQQRADEAEQEVVGMTKIAYQDALTHVKSKAAYNAFAEELAGKIENGTAEFAIVMADLNELKVVNDTYGHENGNLYLIGACQIICDAFKHSPVFRIGGDEFVVVLENDDYHNREALLAELAERFHETFHDMTREPWDRYSSALGMATYRPGEDPTVTDVFNRADTRMYHNKKEHKARMAAQ